MNSQFFSTQTDYQEMKAVEFYTKKRLILKRRIFKRLHKYKILKKQARREKDDRLARSAMTQSVQAFPKSEEFSFSMKPRPKPKNIIFGFVRLRKIIYQWKKYSTKEKNFRFSQHNVGNQSFRSKTSFSCPRQIRKRLGSREKSAIRIDK
mmetsp:Transcript_933/g.810  ORF Transcript_933/g.810 Transcript_933/m.810 type:complete len:150 (+) Transcript_933:455-904(+)